MTLAVAGVASAAEAPAGDGGAAPDAGDRLTWGVVPSGPDGAPRRSRFELDVDPGAELVEHVGIVNYTYGELTLDVYAHDAFTTDTGGFDVLPAAGTSTGAGSWIALGAREVTIPPRSRVDLPFRLTVPGNATPGDHAAGIVAAHTSTSVDDDGNRVTIDNRVGARVYLRVSGDLHPRLDVGLLDARYQQRVNPVGRGTVTFTYQVVNTGNVRLAARPVVSTTLPFGWLRHATDGDLLPELLPGETFVATAELPAVAPLGWLRGTVELTPIPPEDGELDGHVPTVAAIATVWAVPWSALGAVLLVVVTVRLARRRQADIVRGLGWLLVVVALVIALYLVHLRWFSGLETARAQQRLEAHWTQLVTHASAERRPPETGAAAAARPAPAVGEPFAALRFEREGRPIVSDGVLYVLEGIGHDQLRQGPGHYPSTASPGMSGNVAIAGHRTTYGAPFWSLDDLRHGDTIHLVDPHGIEWTYAYVRQHVVAPTDTWVLGDDPLGTAVPTLTLTTCHPRHSAAQRLVVVAELTARGPASPPWTSPA